MWRETACNAIAQSKCLQLSYDGFSRIVEVLMRVWQVRGGSESLVRHISLSC